MSYRAVVIGSTGAVGTSLVRELIASPLCEQVTAVVRQESAVDFFENCFPDPLSKLRVCVLDMDQLGTDAVAPARNCEVAFCTMGIGQPANASKAQFWKVDVEYAVSFARACKIAGVKHFSLLSALGANVNSHFHYWHVKGVAEERISALGFKRVSLFRPSLLVTRHPRYGWKDRLTQTLFPLVSPFLSPRFRQIEVEKLGRAMRISAEQRESPGVEHLEYPQFQNLLTLPARAQAASAK